MAGLANEIGVFFFGSSFISILVLLRVSTLFFNIYYFFNSLIVSLLPEFPNLLPNVPLDFYFYFKSLLFIKISLFIY